MAAKIHAIGNAVRDCELSETASGVQVCRFTLAVNRGYGENRVTDCNGVEETCRERGKVRPQGEQGLRVRRAANPQVHGQQRR